MIFEKTLNSHDVLHESFQIPLLENRNIEIKYNKVILSWVKDYKPDFYKECAKIKKENFSELNIETSVFALIRYFFEFIFDDIQDLIKNQCFPLFNQKVLELGSGIGFFSLIVYKALEGKISLDLVELPVTDEENDPNCFAKKMNIKVAGMSQGSIRKKQKKTNTIDLLKEFTKINDVKCNIYTPDELRAKKNENEYDFVYSFRSYCFLYDHDIYSDYLIKNMKKNSLIICDVAENVGQHLKFSKTFQIQRKIKNERKMWFYRNIATPKK